MVKTLVVKDPADLRLTIPTPSPAGQPYSLLLTVYDETGASGKVRYDGLEVGRAGGKCENVSATIGTANTGRVSYTGTCVTGLSGNKRRYTPNAIDVNGLKVEPPAGTTIVIDAVPGKQPEIFGTKQDVGKSAGKALKRNGQLVLLIDGVPLATLSSKLQKLLTRPKLSSSGSQVPVGPNAAFEGFRIAGGLSVKLHANPVGKSMVTFNTRMPDIMAPPDQPSLAPTGLVTRPGFNAGKKTVLTPCSSCPVAARKRPATRDGRRAAARAARREALAKAAAVSLPQIEVTKGADLNIGGFKVFDQKKYSPIYFTYDPPTGSFVGDASIKLFGSKVKLNIVIRDGDFVSAEGKLIPPGLGIPLGGGAFLEGFSFGIIAQPDVTLSAGVLFYYLGKNFVQGEGSISFTPRPFHLGAKLEASVLNTKMAEAYVDLWDGRFVFGGRAHGQFGPAKFEAKVAGDFSGDGFNIEGEGKACVGVCLTIRALLSSKAVAACGELDLYLTKLSAGFGFYWSGALDVFFSSCDLAPYRAVLAPPPASRGGNMTRALRADSPSLAIPNVEPGLELAVFNFAAPSGTGGVTPRVRLVAPDGRTWSTNAILGGQERFQPDGVFVDQDTTLGRARFLVPKPVAGTWKVEALPGSPPIVGIDIAKSVPPLSKELFSFAKVDQPGKSEAASVVAAKTPLRGVLPADPKYTDFLARPGVPKGQADRHGIGLESASSPLNPALASIVPKTLATAANPAKLRRFRYQGTFPAGTKLTFVERGPLTDQRLRTVIVPPTGVARGSFVFLPGRTDDAAVGVATWGGKRQIAVEVVNPREVPRGRIDNLASYVAPTDVFVVAKPIGIVEAGGKLNVVLDRPAGPGPIRDIVVTARSGERRVYLADAEDVRRLPAKLVSKVEASSVAVRRALRIGEARARAHGRATSATPRVYVVPLNGLRARRDLRIDLFTVRGAGRPRSSIKRTTIGFKLKAKRR